ncbi:MAG: hypothetical protein J2P18_10780 [Nocardia sp.]|nr:hypothetical protein [Nocardia sp.]
MQKFVDNMHTNHDLLTQQINKVSTHKEALAAAMKTTSAAGQALQNAANSFIDAATKMNNNLLHNAEKLQRAQQGYTNQEDHNASSVSAVGNTFLDHTV